MFSQTLKSVIGNKLFSKINESDINLHLNLNNLLFRPKGDTVYIEGDQAEEIFLILDGKIEIFREKNLGSTKSDIRGEGAFFGEEDYLENMPRTSSAIALTDCKFLVIERPELELLISESKQILINLSRSSELRADNFFIEDNDKNETNDFFVPGDMESNIEQIGVQEIIPASNSLEENNPRTGLSNEQLHMIIHAAQIVNSNIKLDDVLDSILESAKNITHAERGTLYLVDKEKNEIWSKISDASGVTEIRLKLGDGIAGWVAQNNETVNIKDVQNDSRFNKNFDYSTGYKTKNMLCFPITNKSNTVIGVLQLINCKYGSFSILDEQFLSALSIHAALALENAELVEKLLQTERITSLGKMVNFLIQDIKKPILVSKRYTEHLKSKKPAQDVNQVLDLLLEQLNHVADLVQSTSSYADGQSVLHSTTLKLNEVLNEVLGKLESNVQIRKSEIIKQFDKDVAVKLDRKEFALCCMHIIRNACDAMPDGGKIIISTKINNGSVLISFKDNGLGIPDSIKEKIFDPFMSHGKSEGTGLGLSITKKIIEDLGGKIEVESDLGEGAVFMITFPILQ